MRNDIKEFNRREIRHIIRVMVKNQLKACVHYLKPVIDDHNLFSTSSDIKDEEEAGDGANPKDEQEESDDFPGNAILPIGVDVVRYLYHLIEQAGTTGTTQPNLYKQTKIGIKLIQKQMKFLIKQYGIVSVAEHHGKQVTYLLYTKENYEIKMKSYDSEKLTTDISIKNDTNYEQSNNTKKSPSKPSSESSTSASQQTTKINTLQRVRRKSKILQKLQEEQVVNRAIIRKYIRSLESDQTHIVDAKSVRKIVMELEGENQLKQLTVNTPSISGSYKTHNLIVLPHLSISDPIVQDFITQIRDNEVNFQEFTAAPPNTAPIVDVEVDRLDITRTPAANNGLNVALNYGWIRSKMIRAKEFHIYLFQTIFDKKNTTTTTATARDRPQISDLHSPILVSSPPPPTDEISSMDISQPVIPPNVVLDQSFQLASPEPIIQDTTQSFETLPNVPITNEITNSCDSLPTPINIAPDPPNPPSNTVENPLANQQEPTTTPGEPGADGEKSGLFVMAEIINKMPFENYLQYIGNTSLIDDIEDYVPFTIEELPSELRRKMFDKRSYVRRIQASMDLFKKLKLVRTEFENNKKVLTYLQKSVEIIDRTVTPAVLRKFTFNSTVDVVAFWTKVEYLSSEEADSMLKVELPAELAARKEQLLDLSEIEDVLQPGNWAKSINNISSTVLRQLEEIGLPRDYSELLKLSNTLKMRPHQIKQCVQGLKEGLFAGRSNRSKLKRTSSRKPAKKRNRSQSMKGGSGGRPQKKKQKTHALQIIESSYQKDGIVNKTRYLDIINTPGFSESKKTPRSKTKKLQRKNISVLKSSTTSTVWSKQSENSLFQVYIEQMIEIQKELEPQQRTIEPPTTDSEEFWQTVSTKFKKIAFKHKDKNEEEFTNTCKSKVTQLLKKANYRLSASVSIRDKLEMIDSNFELPAQLEKLKELYDISPCNPKDGDENIEKENELYSEVTLSILADKLKCLMFSEDDHYTVTMIKDFLKQLSVPDVEFIFETLNKAGITVQKRSTLAIPLLSHNFEYDYSLIDLLDKQIPKASRKYYLKPYSPEFFLQLNEFVKQQQHKMFSLINYTLEGDSTEQSNDPPSSSIDSMPGSDSASSSQLQLGPLVNNTNEISYRDIEYELDLLIPASHVAGLLGLAVLSRIELLPVLMEETFKQFLSNTNQACTSTFCQVHLLPREIKLNNLSMFVKLENFHLMSEEFDKMNSSSEDIENAFEWKETNPSDKSSQAPTKNKLNNQTNMLEYYDIFSDEEEEDEEKYFESNSLQFPKPISFEIEPVTLKEQGMDPEQELAEQIKYNQTVRQLRRSRESLLRKKSRLRKRAKQFTQKGKDNAEILKSIDTVDEQLQVTKVKLKEFLNDDSFEADDNSIIKKEGSESQSQEYYSQPLSPNTLKEKEAAKKEDDDVYIYEEDEQIQFIMQLSQESGNDDSILGIVQKNMSVLNDSTVGNKRKMMDDLNEPQSKKKSNPNKDYNPPNSPNNQSRGVSEKFRKLSLEGYKCNIFDLEFMYQIILDSGKFGISLTDIMQKANSENSLLYNNFTECDYTEIVTILLNYSFIIKYVIRNEYRYIAESNSSEYTISHPNSNPFVMSMWKTFTGEWNTKFIVGASTRILRFIIRKPGITLVCIQLFLIFYIYSQFLSFHFVFGQIFTNNFSK